jgi:VanZ family protein
MAVIFYLSSLHDAPLPGDVSDKAGHLVGYAVLGVLVTRGVAGRLPSRISLRVALLSLLITTAYGLSDELHQTFVPGRSADIYDVAADAAGGLIALGACALWGILPLRSAATEPRHDL